MNPRILLLYIILPTLWKRFESLRSLQPKASSEMLAVRVKGAVRRKFSATLMSQLLSLETALTSCGESLTLGLSPTSTARAFSTEVWFVCTQATCRILGWSSGGKMLTK